MGNDNSKQILWITIDIIVFVSVFFGVAYFKGLFSTGIIEIDFGTLWDLIWISTLIFFGIMLSIGAIVFALDHFGVI